MTTPTPTVSPKAKQFQEELQALLDKYQYRLIPQVEYRKTGILPVFGLQEVVPPKGTDKPEAKESVEKKVSAESKK